ncbi:MAG: D-alanyl-D-alanine carboxypeptidase/D-alanyl-D-alanine-endopeptidase [Candidatus Binatia bacterium]
MLTDLVEGAVVHSVTSVFPIPMKKLWYTLVPVSLALFIALEPPLAEARGKRIRPAVRRQQAARPPQPPAPPQSPDVLLERSGLADEEVGYLLFDPQTGRSLEEHRADEHRIPASTAKAVTMIAALKILGADYRFQTTLLTTGEVVDGTLRGNIYLRGGGDPVLTTDDLREMAALLPQAGITRIAGDFIFDDSFLTRTEQIDQNIAVTAAYNPGLSALSVNFNRIQIHWQQQQQRRGPSVFKTDVFSHAKGGSVPVDLITLGRLADEFDSEIAFLHNPMDYEGITVDRWLLSRKLRSQGWAVLPVKLDPGLITATLFHTLCEQQGVTLPLPQRAPIPAQARVLYTHYSEPLPEIASKILRFSNNLAAELVGLVASRRLSTHPLSLRESAARLTNWYLRQLPDHSWDGFVYANHSGLTTATRISPRQMATILRYGWRLPVGEATFPDLLWPPGWARNRNNPDQVPVRAKSGTMNFADGLVGFLTTDQGRDLGFVVLITNFPQRLAQNETQDVRTTAAETGSSGWTRRAKVLERQLVQSWMARY